MNGVMALTGERPGVRKHGFETLQGRFALQAEGRCFFMIADYQALAVQPGRAPGIEGCVREMVLDYLAAGFDPQRGICFLQSQVPQLAELTAIFGHLVSLPRLVENPEIARLGGPVSIGFAGYPVSQAADILLFRPKFVPTGSDQRAHVELARGVARRFNRTYGPVFPLPEGMYNVTIKPVDPKAFRERRRAFEARRGLVRDILNLGRSEARIQGQRTLEAVKDALGLRYRTLFA